MGKKVESTSDIPVVIEPPATETNKEIADTMELYRVFSRSLFGENHEPGKIKVKRGQPNPQKITMLKVERDFIISQKGRNNTESTIKTYEKHFNRIFDFLGFQYLTQGKEVVDEAIENSEYYGSARQIGASMPVLVLEIDSLPAFYQDYMREVKKLSEQTIISSMRHLRAIIYYAQEQKWIKDFNIKVRDIPPGKKSVFTEYEIEKLRRKPKITANNFVEYRSYVMIQYLAATGNRVSSMLALDVRDIDFEEGSITVNVQKNRQPKTMPLVYDLRKVLKEYIYHARCDENGEPLLNEPLFCTRTGERLTYNGARDGMRDYFEARGVKWQGFHKFRYSYAANWIKDGGNPFMLKEQLGHSSLAMTNRYVTLYGLETKKEAEEHSLSKKFAPTTGRKAIKMRT